MRKEMDSIIVKNITKTFKNVEKTITLHNTEKKSQSRFVALEDVSFTISKGEMIGIIGLNGSGKTTLLRIISGIYKPDSGNVEVNGKIAPLLQIGTGFHEELVAKDNIIMYGMYLGFSKNEIKQKIDNIIEFAELENFTNMKLKHYSAGMKSRLAFSTALQIDPDILLVDEILAVGDIVFKKKSFNSFLLFKQKKKTVIYTSHNTSQMKELCNRIILLHKSKLIMIGKPDEVLAKYKEIIENK